MLGILDAFPDDNSEAEQMESEAASTASSEMLAGSPFGELMNLMLPFIRPLLGRPFSAYGMTPLMIFREIFA
jgi:hypothetical protein